MDKSEWQSIARGAALALAGAGLTYAAEFVIPQMQASGSATLLVVAAGASVGINVLRKWLAARSP